MKKNFFIKTMSLLIILIMLASGFSACGDNDSPNSGKEKEDNKTLNFWYFNKDEGNTFVEEFKESNPDYKVKLTINLNDDNAYETKITQLIQSGSDQIPDVFAAESAYVKKLVNLDGGFSDLKSDPFNVADEDLSNMYEYTVGVGKSNDGTLKALAHQATPNGLGYKRDLTKKFLGTDDPEKIAEMMSSTEKMLATGMKLKDQNATLFSGVDDIYRIFFGLREKPWVVDNKLVIDPVIEEFIKFSKELRENNLDSKVPQQWQAEWDKAIADETTVFFPICTWGVPYIIGRDESAVDAERWGIAQRDKTTAWGGTWFGVAENSSDKEGAWKLVQSITMDEKTMEQRAINAGDFVNNKSVSEKLAEDESLINKTVNQNTFQIFAPLAEKIDANLFTEIDSQCETTLLQLVKTYLDTDSIKDEKEVIKQFKDEMKSSLKDTDIEVD